MAIDTKKNVDYNVHLYRIPTVNNKFVDKQLPKEYLTYNNYEILFVVGQSLDVFGIYDGDVVLVKPVSINDIAKVLTNEHKSPICVFKINNELMPYKVWTYLDFTKTNVRTECVTDIIKNCPEFVDITKDIRYTTHNNIAQTFAGTTINMTRGGMCTMLNTKNQWIFKAMDLRNVVGIVEYVFTPENKIR